VQTGSRAHPVPYSMTTSVSSLGVKGSGCEADSCLIILCWGLEWVELNLHSPVQAFKGCTKTLLLFLHFNIIIPFMLTAHTSSLHLKFSHPTHASLPITFIPVNCFKLNLNLLQQGLWRVVVNSEKKVN